MSSVAGAQKLIKSEHEIEKMRVAGRIVGEALNFVGRNASPGITTGELDSAIGKLIRDRGALCAFFGYQGFPNNSCISVNNEVIHGLPGGRRLQFGDILKVDVGVSFERLIADGAWTFAVGGVRNAETQKLLDVTESALDGAVRQVRHGVKISAIGAAVQDTVERAGFSVVREFVGHGVGRNLHEDPKIPNYRTGDAIGTLAAGMTVAIEPMVNVGMPKVRVKSDGWTVETADGSLSAHFEHTVLVTMTGSEILTCGGQEKF